MDPKLVVVIGNKGVQLVRLVASNDKEENESIALYLKARKFLNPMDRILRGSNQAIKAEMEE